MLGVESYGACRSQSAVPAPEATAAASALQVHSLLNVVRPDRQTLLFSATLPRRIEALVAEALSNPVRISVGLLGAANADVTQRVEILPGGWRMLRVERGQGLGLECKGPGWGFVAEVLRSLKDDVHASLQLLGAVTRCLLMACLKEHAACVFLSCVFSPASGAQTTLASCPG